MIKKLKLKTLDNYKISATHNISKGRGISIWLHGITVDKDEYLGFFKEGTEYLATKGIDTFRIDFRGHGKSDGSSLDFTIIGQMLDVKCSIEYLKEKYDFSKTKLQIVGCSFGAPPAIYTALEFSSIVDNIVLIAPVISYKRTFLEPMTDWAKSIFNKTTMESFNKTKKIYFNENFPVGPQLLEEMKIIKPEIAILNLNQKTTIIHGDSDTMVPYSVSNEIASKKATINFMTIPYMDHGFMDIEDEEGNGPKSIANKKIIYEAISNMLL